MSILIQVCDLRKSYGSTQAVNGVSFQISKGEVFGLLGPNGAGKTTTIAMMTGLIRPQSGSVRLDGGGDPQSPTVRRKIGLAPQALAIYDPLSAYENLAFFAKLYGLHGAKLRDRIHWALDLSGLQERKNDKVENYSGGMKRRLNFACALVQEPSVVFLDEPTVGVDPQSRNYIFDSVERLKREGLTVVYTTHYMEEAERLCDRVAIMDHGQILAMDTVPALVAKYGGESLITAEITDSPKNPIIPTAEIEGENLSMRSQHPFKDVAMLADSGIEIKSLKVDAPDLESVFLSLTGRSLRD